MTYPFATYGDPQSAVNSLPSLHLSFDIDTCLECVSSTSFFCLSLVSLTSHQLIPIHRHNSFNLHHLREEAAHLHPCLLPAHTTTTAILSAAAKNKKRVCFSAHHQVWKVIASFILLPFFFPSSSSSSSSLVFGDWMSD